MIDSVKMSLIQPKSSLKRNRSSSELSESSNICILCDKPCSENKSSFPDDRWHHMKNEAYLWKGLDTFGDIYEKIDWGKGTTGIYFHKLCHLNLKSERKLEQAKKRSEKNNLESF